MDSIVAAILEDDRPRVKELLDADTTLATRLVKKDYCRSIALHRGKIPNPRVQHDDPRVRRKSILSDDVA